MVQLKAGARVGNHSHGNEIVQNGTYGTPVVKGRHAPCCTRARIFDSEKKKESQTKTSASLVHTKLKISPYEIRRMVVVQKFFPGGKRASRIESIADTVQLPRSISGTVMTEEQPSTRTVL